MTDIKHCDINGPHNIVEAITRTIRILWPVVGESDDRTGFADYPSEADIPPVKRRLYVDFDRMARR